MRKRSKYRPKGIRMDTVNYVIGGLHKVSSHPSAIDLRIRNHAALAALTSGTAKRDDMDVLIAAFNVCEALVIINPELGADWKQEITEGQNALFDVSRRGVESNKFILFGAEMKALNMTMEIHDAQLDQASIFELEKAIDTVASFIRNKKARSIK